MAARTFASKLPVRKISDREAAVLRLIKAGRMRAVLNQHWTYKADDRACTSVVMGLSAKAMVVLDPSGGVSLNERGRMALSNDDRNLRKRHDGDGRA